MLRQPHLSTYIHVTSRTKDVTQTYYLQLESVALLQRLCQVVDILHQNAYHNCESHT